MLCLVASVPVIFGCKPDPRPLPPDEVAARVANGKAGRAFHLVDLRPDAAYQESHLPSAVNVPYSRLGLDRMLFLDGRPVIFYDRGKPDVGRLRAHLGRRLPANVVFLAGGIARWQREGLPIEREPE